MAVSGALARCAERVLDRTDLQPARWTVDLCRPAEMAPVTVRASIARSGRRLCLVESVLTQRDCVVGKASALFLRPTLERPSGTVWAPPSSVQPPPRDLMPAGSEPRLYFSIDAGWTATSAAHQNSSRKQLWLLPFTIVRGERPTPFQHVASVADVASVVTHWGDAGLEYINADITLNLVRLPTDYEVGLTALDRVEHDGIATGTAAVFDRAGRVGTALVSALVNTAATVDPRHR